MFRLTKNQSSWSLVQCLAKNYKNDYIVFVDVDKFTVYVGIYSELHTRTTGHNMLP